MILFLLWLRRSDSTIKLITSLLFSVIIIFSYLDCKMFLKMYTSFVRPYLEYAQAVWAPFLRKYIIMIENVQIRATKLVDGLGKLKYKDTLTRLNLLIFWFMRICGDMIET